AMKSIEALGISDKVTVIGIAKRLEEIYFPGDSIPLYINKKSESLKLIQQARNEAHRFAITFHRQKRGKELSQTVLTTIPGIGAKTAQKLLLHFGSVVRLQQASVDEIAKVIGKQKTKVLLEHLNGTQTNAE
ncbi:MAG TPA: helix-hairpin-helix domain-containing protein, partial [Saprospiraceae bacterium]|nr:helix-hairpin-helix domain-containing protein [Saprospiraceae bacterium]